VATPKREKHSPPSCSPPTSPCSSSSRTPRSLGARDLAWLELLYASGLRISELVGIDVDDLELRSRLVKVTARLEERIVPFGSKAEAALRAWLAARGTVATDAEEQAVFVNHRGRRITTRQRPPPVRPRTSGPPPARRHLAAHCCDTRSPRPC